MSTSDNIFPIFDRLVQRDEKERLLNQKGVVLWLTGLSGSGKSTIAIGLEQKLFAEGFLTQLLDGDNIRNGINNNLSFSDSDRKENIRRIAEISKLFLNCGVICINCFVSPTKEIRKTAKDIIGYDFIEVYINTSLEICEQRDVKGLYQQARAGKIKDFTGISSPFEAPEAADIEIKTENKSIEESVNELYTKIIDRIKK